MYLLVQSSAKTFVYFSSIKSVHLIYPSKPTKEQQSIRYVMNRSENPIPFQSAHFADDYEVFVDYGKGRPVKIHENETTFIDVQKFLTGRNDRSEKQIKKNFHRLLGINTSSTREHDDKQRQMAFDKHWTSKIHREDSLIADDQTWFCNKRHNPRLTTLHDRPIRSSKDTRMLQTISIERPFSHAAISRRKFRLNIAVNGASKSLRDRVPTSNWDLTTGDFGDDAGIFAENNDFSLVGLADGASGNHLLGINPADFPRAILSACQKIFHRNHIPSNRLSRLIHSAIEQVQHQQIRGSSTLCLLSLDKSKHRLTTLNIGDSGFVVYRKNQLFHRSTCTMQSDGFAPKQLFALENSMNLPCFLDEKEILRDCSIDRIAVEKNDIIIISSDGLWNVIKSTQMKQLIDKNHDQDIQHLADDLLDQAVNGYVTNNRDDILIIVCRVEES